MFLGFREAAPERVSSSEKVLVLLVLSLVLVSADLRGLVGAGSQPEDTLEEMEPSDADGP